MTPLRVQGRLARFLKASLHLPGQHRVKIPYHSVICTSQYFRRTLASSSQVPSREGTGPDNSEAKRLGRPTRPTTGAIRTLCPANLTREDYLTVYRWRDHPTLTFYVLLPHGARHVTVHFPMVESLQLTSGSDRGGSLYYHRPSRAPPLAGEIRFRLTPSPEPTSFSAGVDLTNKSGTPWRISLPSIPTCESWDPFGVLLNEVDQTVSEEVMTLARESGGLRTTCSGDSYVTRCLYAFGQPFEFSLDQKWHTFTLVGKDALLRANLPRISCAPTKRGHKQYPQQSPFSGKCSGSRSVAVITMLATDMITIHRHDHLLLRTLSSPGTQRKAGCGHARSADS